ncbi:MAG: Ig-like domain-containing protein [Catonella sp.]|uniref:Ig-like domain-containing protein n=1 Tax=Catonella sp. TaxID=2382125 RepID=UPI003FA0FD4A
MIKKLTFVVRIILLFTFLLVAYNYLFVVVKAEERIIKVKNGTSGDIRIKEDDFVTFLPQLKNKKLKSHYMYYSPENGKNLFQFGNGKYWASRQGVATVIISGVDRHGNLNFIADYNVIIESIKGTTETVINNNGFSSTSVLLAVGEVSQLRINEETNGIIEWISANSDVAEVDSKGNVTGKSKGNTLVTAKVSGKIFGWVVSVTSETRKRAVEWAKNYSSKSEYSQSKRMEEGYYDCSSLAWRAYNKLGFNILSDKYAPTAANMGKFYDEKKQIVEGGISAENINKLIYEPGDLFFMEGPVNNGRYRNVYHVEMISGYTFKGIDKSGKPIIELEFANRKQVDFRGFVGKPEI